MTLFREIDICLENYFEVYDNIYVMFVLNNIDKYIC